MFHSSEYKFFSFLIYLSIYLRVCDDISSEPELEISRCSRYDHHLIIQFSQP
jgi:hypothetical protein